MLLSANGSNASDGLAKLLVSVTDKDDLVDAGRDSLLGEPRSRRFPTGVVGADFPVGGAGGATELDTAKASSLTERKLFRIAPNEERELTMDELMLTTNSSIDRDVARPLRPLLDKLCARISTKNADISDLASSSASSTVRVVACITSVESHRQMVSSVRDREQECQRVYVPENAP
jgi:hypothetical protein